MNDVSELNKRLFQIGCHDFYILPLLSLRKEKARVLRAFSSSFEYNPLPFHVRKDTQNFVQEKKMCYTPEIQIKAIFQAWKRKAREERWIFPTKKMSC